MSIFEELKTNKGTVSSALGKKLAADVLNGNFEILQEAIELSCYQMNNKNEKSIRAGAAKIVECVALEKPDLVAPHLDKLLPALKVNEPQTRWMVIRTIGLCASLRPQIAKQGIPFARKYIREKLAGQLCLVGAADSFLGDYGSLSRETAAEVYPILLESTDNVIMNEHDWIMEAFMKIAKYLDAKEKEMVKTIAHEFSTNAKNATVARSKKLTAMCQ